MKDRYTEKKKVKDEAKGEVLTGTFMAHPKGFGFVRVEDMEDDLFIPERDVNGAFHMDTVQVEIMPEREDRFEDRGRRGRRGGENKSAAKAARRTEARVIRVLEHGITELVGTFEKSKNYGFVVPDNQKITNDVFVSKQGWNGARNNDKVVVKLTRYGENGMKPEGKIVRIIGGKDEPGTDIMSVVSGYDLPVEFPEEVMMEAKRLPQKVSKSARKGRLDLRKLQTVTIDGDHTKDFDDAVTLTFDGSNYHLGVHIADVAEYVKEGSALDQEALRRGTSVYLVDRVIPMLPVQLSNGICSLNQGEDRLTLSCLMTFGKRGKLKEYQIAETVINVDKRMTYNKVTEALNGTNPDVTEEYRDFMPMIYNMQKLARALRARRVKRGAIDFDFPEIEIVVDEKGLPVDVVKAERNEASMIIEDFMLAANETVGEAFCKANVPFLYRNHATPDPMKVEELANFAGKLGFKLNMKNGKPTPKDYQELLAAIAGHKEEAILSKLVLRSMQQADYGPVCVGHFGLAAEYYSHFTSPIRRYPDTQIHRIIKETLRGKVSKKWRNHYEKLLEEVGESTSSLERRSDEVEREVDKMKMAEYMKAYVGQEFEGKISGITGWGIYVELESGVEGMIHVSNMFDDHYNFDEESYQMVGERTGRCYELGQKIRIKVVDADKEKKIIDFAFA